MRAIKKQGMPVCCLKVLSSPVRPLTWKYVFWPLKSIAQHPSKRTSKAVSRLQTHPTLQRVWFPAGLLLPVFRNKRFGILFNNIAICWGDLGTNSKQAHTCYHWKPQQGEPKAPWSTGHAKPAGVHQAASSWRHLLEIRSSCAGVSAAQVSLENLRQSSQFLRNSQRDSDDPLTPCLSLTLLQTALLPKPPF